MKSIIIAVLILFSQVTFAQKVSNMLFPPPVLPDGYPNYVNACDLNEHRKELVYTRFTYSGIEEYWSLHSWNKDCKDVGIELEIPDNINIKSRHLKELRYVHENYWKCYLVIDVVGFFEEGYVYGYGHLGMNKSKFTVKQIMNIQIMNKK
ncbi:hypothetical protein [Mucilaginibacter polytrichastri]|uniref:Beta/gamma crystallin 'Greek key' domain-containing protein n=1 Tax=Mucilaginibacter polytrichastri TaxID=1302689 RepID=A0A1Q6A0Y3_9SPHI|nr:hypothetical protein [Mucilaginibacter polytrichastri]OKS87663.1 hypothetical protein RG47T_3125 [Mucilaginibacter polytrichastri]SFT20340.1 hypothetical protein SAMN04487890_11696 [Mucilaginibacter polytrichastri]